jgi:hypothetical protein
VRRTWASVQVLTIELQPRAEAGRQGTSSRNGRPLPLPIRQHKWHAACAQRADHWLPTRSVRKRSLSGVMMFVLCRLLCAQS